MKTIKFFKFAILVMLICFSSVLSATNWYLSPTGSDTNDGSSGTPFKTLSKALSAATTNDVIHVTGFIDMTAEPSKPGVRGDIALAGTSTYTTGGVTYNTWNVNSTLGIITLNKTLTIVGDDKSTCGFDGKNATCIIRQDGSSGTVTYQNLTFKNGKSADASGGGGMYIRSTTASFTNCEFSANASGGTSNVNPGGAVTIISATATFNTTRFATNIAKSGCGIYAQSGTITLDGCTIENNDASGVGSSVGGGIYAATVSGGALLNMDVKNTLLKNNKAASSGGALYYSDAAAFASTLKFTNCAFISNQVTTNYGGGAFIDNKTASSTLNLSFINTTFYDNLVGGTSGAALFVNSALTGSFVNLINCTITANKVTGTTGSAGAAIRMLSTTLNSTRKIYNCIIENNVGTTEDMSVLNNYTDLAIQSDAYTAGSTLVIDKSFIARSTNTNFSSQFGSSNTVNYAAVTSGSIANSFRAQFGTFNSSGNYFPLQSTSPAIGYGTTSYLSSLSPTVTTDQLGYTRPSPCNAGAVEVKTVTVSSNSNLSTLGTTSATEITVTGNELTIDQTSTLRSVTVNPGAKLTLNSGYTLTSGSLTLQSDATGTGTFVDKNVNGGLSVTGIATVKQYLSSSRNWYMSSPVSAAASLPTVDSGTLTLYSYPESDSGQAAGANGYAAGAVWNTVSTGTMTVGTGYIVKPGATTSTVTFTGTGLNTGNQTISALTYTAANPKHGFNLIGNPYPSYLNVLPSISVNTAGLEPTVWYRTRDAAGYYHCETVNASDGVGTNASLTGRVTGYIPPMQGFWVRTKLNNQSITLSNSNRSHTTSVDLSSQGLGSVPTTPLKAPAKKNQTNSLLGLSVSNGITGDETIIKFYSEATNNLDAYDSGKMSNGNVNIPELFTVVDGSQLAINTMNSIPYDTEIALGFSTGKSGDFTINTSLMSNFAEGTQILLKDNIDPLNPVLTDLAKQSYSFNSDTTTSNTSRFTLIFKAPSVATEINSPENNVWISTRNGQIVVNGTANRAILEIFNAVGQKIISRNLSESKNFMSNNLPTGAYLVKLTNEGKSITRRIIVD